MKKAGSNEGGGWEQIYKGERMGYTLQDKPWMLRWQQGGNRYSALAKLEFIRLQLSIGSCPLVKLAPFHRAIEYRYDS